MDIVMPERMLKFVATPQAMPDKRPAAERRRDFDEIYANYAREKAAEQAARCSQCGVPFCQIHCPLHNNIPDWLKLTAEGRLEEAYELSSATNNFPEICGRICPQDRLCEGNCVIEKGFESVTIGSVEKFITDTAWNQGWVQPIKPRRERPESVGIVGAGPAGLAAAEQLRRKGYQVTVYDRYDRVGGLLIYGIPNFKLEKDIVQRREKLLRDSKVTFELNCEVGRDVTMNELRQRHAVVIGGGDTAMDCVRTAVRQGAKSVKCLYRRDRANMPGSQREVKHAEEEGVEFVWLSAPQGFLGKDHVSHVRSVRIHLGMPDSTGRQTPQEIPNSHTNIHADLVLKALGFDPEDLPELLKAPDLGVTGWGTLKIDWKSMMTNLDGLFAAGDIVRGASLVVWAVRDGRDAAERIHTYLTTKAAAAVAIAAE